MPNLRQINQVKNETGMERLLREQFYEYNPAPVLVKKKGGVKLVNRRKGKK